MAHEEQWKKRAKELTDKGMVDEDQKNTLNKMISSPDKENAYLAKEIMGSKIAKELAEGLNEGQTEAFADILDFFGDPTEEAFVLKGYAGTGKTFLVKRILEYITGRFPNRKIAITAPTNKAVRVLQANAPFSSKATEGLVFDNLFDAESKLTYQTIHKLLGLKEQITSNGQQLFKPDGRNKSDLTKMKYLIVDEVSMLDDELCEEILKYSDQVKILFMGDPAQIPPVNKADCIPFRDNHQHVFRRAELTEIMRQKGDHPVVDASFLIRNNLSAVHPIPKLKTNLNAEGHGIVYFHSETQRAEVRPMLKEYFDTDEFREDANYAKVIAWRNKTVHKMNTVIRELLYGADADRFVVGEKLIASSPIFEKSRDKWGDKWAVAFNTSEEMEVVEIKETTKPFREGDYRLTADIWQLKVKLYDPIDKKNKFAFVNVIRPESAIAWKDLIKEAKDIAVRRGGRQLWIPYYNMMKWSADVVYNYAITCHKAQGSTYSNVLLIEEDMEANRKVLERNRIKYTAYSRPTDKLFILRKNYI
jgi:ATP-dependent exoDNAse (exonuclease V) alpha subunit